MRSCLLAVCLGVLLSIGGSPLFAADPKAAQRDALVREATELVEMGTNLPEAIRKLDEADKLGIPDRALAVRVCQLKAQALVGIGTDRSEAMKYLDFLEREAPFDPFSHYYRAEWHRTHNEPGEAMFFYNAAARGATKSGRREGLAYTALARRDEVETQLGAAERDKAYNTLFLRYYQRGEHAAAQVALLDRLLQSPTANRLQLLLRRGDAWYWLKDYEKSVADLEEAIRLNGKPISSPALAESYRNLARYPEAVEMLDRLIAGFEAEAKLAPAIHYVRRAQCHIAMKQHDAAGRDLAAAERAGDKSVTLERRQLVRGELLAAQGKSAEAVALWQKTLDAADMFSRDRADLEQKIHQAGALTLGEQRSLDAFRALTNAVAQPTTVPFGK